MAFVSGHIPAKPKGSLPQDNDHISVYASTMLNSTSGYCAMVKKGDVRELDMNVDQALKYVISLGMVMSDDLPVKTPSAQKPFEGGHTEHSN